MSFNVRINRNIVECKLVKTTQKGDTEVTRINRNIVECKFSSSDAVFGSPLELIETLWNVNIYE